MLALAQTADIYGHATHAMQTRPIDWHEILAVAASDILQLLLFLWIVLYPWATAE